MPLIIPEIFAYAIKFISRKCFLFHQFVSFFFRFWKSVGKANRWKVTVIIVIVFGLFNLEEKAAPVTWVYENTEGKKYGMSRLVVTLVRLKCKCYIWCSKATGRKKNESISKTEHVDQLQAKLCVIIQSQVTIYAYLFIYLFPLLQMNSFWNSGFVWIGCFRFEIRFYW